MKIAFIGQKGILQSERSGGVEKRVFEVGKRLVKSGHSVTVFARAKHMEGQPNFVEGMKIEYVPTVYRKNFEAIIHVFLATIKSLFEDFDIYHYHGVGPATLSFIPRLFKPNSRVVVTFHARDQFHQKWNLFGRYYLAFGEWCATRFPHYFITVSHTLQVFCRETYNKNGVYIPNGANIEHNIHSDFINKIGLRNKNYILTVGRLVQFKGIHYLIEAFKGIETDKDLVIVGDGETDYVRKLQKMAGDDIRIRFLGFQQGEELKQIFANAFCLVQPSDSEGLPLTVLEAMSYGTAVLVSDIEENVEAIHRTGFTFKKGDVLDLRKTLIEMMNNPAKVVDEGDEAQAIIATKFNWDRVAERVEEVYITSFH